jgi:hypothetical protein
MLESFTSETFHPLRNSTFHLSAGDRGLELVLAQVNELHEGHDAASRRQFSLLFYGPLSPAWPQRTYEMSHPDLGTFDLFLVPLGPEGAAMRYEAVFT